MKWTSREGLNQLVNKSTSWLYCSKSALWPEHGLVSDHLLTTWMPQGKQRVRNMLSHVNWTWPYMEVIIFALTNSCSVHIVWLLCPHLTCFFVKWMQHLHSSKLWIFERLLSISQIFADVKPHKEVSIHWGVPHTVSDINEVVWTRFLTFPRCYGGSVNAITLVPSATGYVIGGNSTLSRLSSHFSPFRKKNVLSCSPYSAEAKVILYKFNKRVCFKCVSRLLQVLKELVEKKDCYTDGDFIKQQGKLIKGITLLSLPSGPEHRWVSWHQKDF